VSGPPSQLTHPTVGRASPRGAGAPPARRDRRGGHAPGTGCATRHRLRHPAPVARPGAARRTAHVRQGPGAGWADRRVVRPPEEFPW